MITDDAQQLKDERLRFFVRLTERCVDVLTELDSKELRSRYATNEATGVLDSYLFTYLSDRTLFLEVVANIDQTQVENQGSHRFISHPDFEEVVKVYTKSPKKPNPVLEKTRPWDVAVTMVMKVEALEPKFCGYSRRLLKREHTILQHIWQSYLADNSDFDDMSGIPMVFDYSEIPNQTFCLQSSEVLEEVDLYGRLTHAKTKRTIPTLSYMTVEKLGPNLSYLIDLMCIVRRPKVGLNISTAFKVFDQLVCRLLQIHRFGVVHNGVCPQNIYFGRSMCYNVVYLNNFRAATLASSQAGGKTCVNMHLAKDARFAPINMMKSTDMHPVSDLESAFYTLLACTGASLPWDPLLQSRQLDMPFTQSDDSSVSVSVNLGKPPSTPITASSARRFYTAILASKADFWASNIHLERCIANLMHRLADRDTERFQLIAGILQDLYAKVKRLLTTYEHSRNAVDFCSQLCKGGSLMHLYTDLRRSVLMFFSFEDVPHILSNPTHQSRQLCLTKGLSSLVGWNLSEWCFSCVEVRPPMLHGPRVLLDQVR